MIAVVSSTIKPVIKNREITNIYGFEDRLEQTRHTINRLLEVGFDEIYLVDNSPLLSQPQLQNLLQGYHKVNLYHVPQYQFPNKGINELLMLLYATQFLPPYEVIFKISGRYYPAENFEQPYFEDFAVKGLNYHKRNGYISTRGYWVKDVATFENFLLHTVDEVFCYPERIVGPRALLRVLFTKKDIIKFPLNVAIEFAAANILKSEKYKVKLLDQLRVEGLVAGIGHTEKIAE